MLNQRIQTFKYGPADATNKPSAIKAQLVSENGSGSISQSGTVVSRLELD